MPRMADFAIWATAAETGLGWEPGYFMRSYAINRTEANQLALESDPIAVAVWAFMKGQKEWKGTSTELWKELGKFVDEDVKLTKAWPGDARTLSNRMKRLAPALRKIGIEYAEGYREGHTGTRIKTLAWVSEKDRQQRQQRQQEAKALQNGNSKADQTADASADAGERPTDADSPADADDGPADDERHEQRQPENPANAHVSDDADASDTTLQITLHENKADVVNQANGGQERVVQLLRNPPEWFCKQAAVCIREGMTERLLNPLAAAVTYKCLGDPRQWRDIRPSVEGKLKEMAREQFSKDAK
jgi:hypothetical protein